MRWLSSSISFQVGRSDFHPEFPGPSHGNFPQSLGRGGKFGEPPRIPIFRLREPPAFDQGRVIGWVMRSQDCRRMLKSVDQQRTHVIGRVINRPHDLVAPARTKPARGGLEKRRGHIAIVDRLKESKATEIGLLKFVVARIIAGHDPTDDFSPATAGPGQEQSRIAVLIEWVLAAVEKLLSLDHQRRHPRGVVPIDAPGEFDKRIAIARRTDL